MEVCVTCIITTSQKLLAANFNEKPKQKNFDEKHSGKKNSENLGPEKKFTNDA